MTASAYPNSSASSADVSPAGAHPGVSSLDFSALSSGSADFWADFRLLCFCVANALSAALCLALGV